MGELCKFALSTVLVVLTVLGLVLPLYAQSDDISVEIDGSRIINVTVSTNFVIEVWIRGLSNQMNTLGFDLTYDPTQMEYVDSTLFTPSGWLGSNTLSSPGLVHVGAGGGGYQTDHLWLTVTFHCIAPGSSPINVINAQYEDLAGASHDLNVLKGAVTQISSSSVGGVVIPTDKLEILTPYIALAGLIAAISTVYFINKKK